MGCWCSKEDPVYRCLLKPFSRSRSASGPQRNAAGESFTKPFGQRLPGLRVPEEQRRYPVPQRLRRSPERTVTPPARQDLQRTSSQRATEARRVHSREGSPNSATPSAQYSEGVLRELDKLRSSVVDFVDRYFSQSDKFLRSKLRKTIYRLVLENAERHKNSQSHEETADAIEDQFKKIDCGSFSAPTRQRSDLLLICEQQNEIGKNLNQDPGCWKFKWSRGDNSLEFPDAERDEVQRYQGLLFEADREGIMDDEQD